MSTKSEVEMEVDYFGGRARLVRFSPHVDERGALLPFPFEQLPFVPCRTFAITDVPVGVVRGGHAHRAGQQLLVCLRGRIEVTLRWRHQEADLILEPAAFGLVCGPGVWCRQKYIDEGSVLLVFASQPYDADSYMRSPE